VNVYRTCSTSDDSTDAYWLPSERALNFEELHKRYLLTMRVKLARLARIRSGINEII
jgi:hypothetical protein